MRRKLMIKNCPDVRVIVFRFDSWLLGWNVFEEFVKETAHGVQRSSKSTESS